MLSSQNVVVIEANRTIGMARHPKIRNTAYVTPEGGNHILACGAYSISAAARHSNIQATVMSTGLDIVLNHLFPNLECLSGQDPSIPLRPLYLLLVFLGNHSIVLKFNEFI